MIKSSRLITSLFLAVFMFSTVTATYAVSLTDITSRLSGDIASSDVNSIVSALYKAILKEGHTSWDIVHLCDQAFYARPDIAQEISRLIRKKLNKNKSKIHELIGSDDNDHFMDMIAKIKTRGNRNQSTPQQGPVTTQERTVRRA